MTGIYIYFASMKMGGKNLKDCHIKKKSIKVGSGALLKKIKKFNSNTDMFRTYKYKVKSNKFFVWF